jgi:hypothetical protein
MTGIAFFFSSCSGVQIALLFHAHEYFSVALSPSRSVILPDDASKPKRQILRLLFTASTDTSDNRNGTARLSLFALLCEHLCHWRRSDGAAVHERRRHALCSVHSGEHSLT